MAPAVTAPTGLVSRRQYEGVRARASIGAWSAVAALTALLLGGTAMSMATRPGQSVEEIIGSLRAAPALASLAAIALACVSVADLGTIAALHDRLQRQGQRLVLLAAGTALLGDMLNIVGRLAQLSQVPIALSSPTHLAPAAMVTADSLDLVLNASGFTLVSVAFALFGALFLRQRRRLLGLVAIATALGTAVGQVRGLEVAFYAANLGFLLWYAALAFLFRSEPASARPHGHQP